ncbi:MAG: rhodanese-like domain-containing protein [Flavobacteriaceae bacterium]
MKSLIAFSLLLIHFQFYSQECPNAIVLEKAAFQQKIIHNDVQLIDVRTEEEFVSGCIDGAFNVDVLKEENFKKQITELNKEEAVYVYCRSGARSKKATQILCEAGFKNIYDLKGGYLIW